MGCSSCAKRRASNGSHVASQSGSPQAGSAGGKYYEVVVNGVVRWRTRAEGEAQSKARTMGGTVRNA